MSEIFPRNWNRLRTIDWRQWKRTIIALLLGQFLSFCITSTGITSQFLASKYSVNAPTTQSFINYFLLCFYFFFYIAKLFRRNYFCLRTKNEIQNKNQNKNNNGNSNHLNTNNMVTSNTSTSSSSSSTTTTGITNEITSIVNDIEENSNQNLIDENNANNENSNHNNHNNNDNNKSIDREEAPIEMPYGFEGLKDLFKHRAIIYLCLAIADVEANYLFVKAYQFTSITSVMLLDCVTIPFVMIFSRWILKRKYGKLHYLGVAICLCGVGFLVLADFLYNPARLEANSPIWGDLMCIGGSLFYAISNVGEEVMVKRRSRLEWLSMIGIFGVIVNGIQLAVLEREEIQNLQWNLEMIGLIVAFALSLFLMYSLAPFMMILSSAVLFNLSILTADIFSLIAAVFLFQQAVSFFKRE